MLSPAGYVSTLDGGIAAPGGYTYPTVAPLSPYGVSSYTAGAFTNVEYIPHRLFVGGFSPTTKEDDLQTFFQQYGYIREVKVIRNIQGVSKGYGFVTFETEEEANLVRNIDPDRLLLRGRRLNLGPAIRRVGMPRYGINDFKATNNQQFWPVNSTFGYAYAYPNSPFLVVSPNQVNTVMFPQNAVSPPTSPTAAVGNF